MKDIARMVAERQGLTRTESEPFVNAMFELIKSALHSDDQVKVKGLGTFKVQTVKSRSSINVNTGERVIIDSHEKITFTPDKAMAESVNKPFGHFETVVLNDGVVFDDMENPADDESGMGDEPCLQEEPSQTSEKTTEINATPEIPEKQIVAPESIDTVPEKQETAADNHIEITAQKKTDEESNRQEPQQEPAMAEPEKIKAADLQSLISVTNQQEEQPETDEEEDIPHEEKSGNKMMLVLYSALLAAFFVAGFFTGRMTTAADHNVTCKTEAPKKKTVVRKVVKVSPKPVAEEKKDTVQVEHPKQETTQLKQEVSQPIKAKPSKETENETPADRYDSDPRVRTGAYTITGIEKTVTAAKGQTLESISKTYLGPGMECYVEAVNSGIKELHEGQKVRIPSLKIKKKKK